MKDKQKRDREFLTLHGQGLTQQEIADTYRITRQRVQQIEKRLGLQRDRSAALHTYACAECKKNFSTASSTRKFCSRECSALGRRVYRTALERAHLQERMKERRRVLAHKYYHEVLKKRADWKRVVNERNRKALLKDKK